MLFPEMHAIVHAQTGTYTSKITSALHHMRKIIVFSLLFCCYYMFPVRIMFPNVMWTLHGKTFCLNFLAECLKQPSKIDLCFKSKYFVISVADQLNQNSFMNCWWNLQTVHILITSYNRLFCFRENILLWCSQPSILPKTNITQQIFLFEGLAWKHGSTQIVFTAIIICLNKIYFLFSAGVENIVQ